MAIGKRLMAISAAAALVFTQAAAAPAAPAEEGEAPAAPICHVDWVPTTSGAYTKAKVTITNKGVAAINGWSLTFILPAKQRIVEAWGANPDSDSGAIAAKDVGINAYVQANGSVTIEFDIEHNGSMATPDAFSVNGHKCSVGTTPPVT